MGDWPKAIATIGIWYFVFRITQAYVGISLIVAGVAYFTCRLIWVLDVNLSLGDREKEGKKKERG